MNSNASKMLSDLNIVSKNGLNDDLSDVNKNFESYISVVNIMKNKDNSNEKVLVWYLKSRSNMDDLDKSFDIANHLVDQAKLSHDSLVYVSIYKMFDNIASFMDSILVSDRLVKKMDKYEYNSFFNILKKCEDAMNKILSLPIVEKNVNRSNMMKTKKRELIDKCLQYGKVSKVREIKENRKDLLKKGLALATGFVSGAAMSCVPGVGYIRMGLAAGKIATSSINKWIDKHPDGNVAKVFTKLGSKINPKIPGLVTNIKDKMRGSYINVFLNGMAVGYIAGNIFELVTGNTVIGALSEQLNSVTDAPVNIETSSADNSINIKVDDLDNTIETTVISEPIPDTVATTDVIETQPIIVDDIGIEESVPTTSFDDVIGGGNTTYDMVGTNVMDEVVTEIDFGQSIDVSSINYGYGTSLDPLVGTEPVKLFTDLGHNVHIGNEQILADGTKMWALFQNDGTGYAWFKADDVIDAISKSSEAGMKLILK